MTMDMEGVVKLTIALPKSAINALISLATDHGKTKTQALREAIALKVYIDRELQVRGTRLLLQRGDGVHEVVFTKERSG